MKQKHQKYTDNQPYPFFSQERQSPNQPLKSPSPDKKRANIITPTKSPQLMDIKRNMIQSRISDKRYEKTPIESKPYEQSTRYYTNEDFQEYRSSHKKNQVLEQLQNMMPKEFLLESNYQYKSQAHPSSNELDYIKLLQEKQRTIKQLHQIIEMINKNNSLQLSASSIKSGSKQNHKRIFQSSNKTVMSYKSNDLIPQKQLKNQVRILTIENQQLVHMIEKLNQQKKEQDLFQNHFQKDQIDYHAHRIKEEILSKEIYQMKESILQKDQNYDQLSRQNKDLYSKYLQLDQQNQKLIKMMKQKELSDRKYHNSLIESTISQRSNISDSQAKQKLSLMKIKEQYNESLKVFKDTVYGDVQDFMREIQANTKELQSKLNDMQNQVRILQKFKSAYERLKKNDLLSSSDLRRDRQEKQLEAQLRQTPIAKTYEIGIQISQIEAVSPQRLKYRQIESLLMEKNEFFQKELQTERSTNRQLINELQELKMNYQLVEGRNQQLLRENSDLVNRLQSRKQMNESRRKNIEQIEDINMANSRQAQLGRLRSLIESQRSEFETQRLQLLGQLSLLKQKNQSYEQIIESQRQMFQQKQMDVQTRISQKENELRRHSSKFQSEIDHLRELLSQKQLLAPSSNVQQQHYQSALEAEVQSLKQSIQLKEIEIQNKSGEIIGLKQKVDQLQENVGQLQEKIAHMQESQESTQQQVKKLVSNYQTQITILKATLSQQKLTHESQLLQLTSEINRLITQSQNSESLLLQSQSNMNQQLSQLQEKIRELQTELNNKNRESRELLHSKSVLESEHLEMKENLEQLLAITKEVEELQGENRVMRERVMEQQGRIQQQEKAMGELQHALDQQRSSNQSLKQQITYLQKDKHQNTQKITSLEQQLTQLISRLQNERKESNDLVNQKEIQFAEQIQRYQEQKAEYEFIIKKLKDQLESINGEIDGLREENISYQEGYNKLLLRQGSLLNQLYQLRSLLTKMQGVHTTTFESSQGQTNYDIGKLCIQYQSQIDQNKLLHTQIDELKEELKKSAEQKLLLQEKISFLEKNILIYQNELKERKSFCQRLINDKNKLEKELLLMKKLKLENRQQETEQIRANLLEKINHLVKIEERREDQIKQILTERRSQSPIRKINVLISKVEDRSGFQMSKVQSRYQSDNAKKEEKP